MTILHDPIRELPQPGDLRTLAREQQKANDRRQLQGAIDHLKWIAHNPKAVELQHERIKRLQQVVDEHEDWLHV